MKAWAFVMIGALLLLGLTGCSVDAVEPLKITAYVNVSSGCQKPTEQLLQDLARKYAARVAVDLVDFGSRAGRERWQADGQHCMTILLNGSAQADIVYKGAQLHVVFQMPPGPQWLPEELETAVRQTLDGVSAADRLGPAISVTTETTASRVLAGQEVIFDAANAAEAEQIRAALAAAAALKPLLQDDFALGIVEGAAKVSLRGTVLLDLGLVEGPVPAEAGAQAEARFRSLINPFPRLSRPFPPGQAGAQMGR
jgi:hypothetical protein